MLTSKILGISRQPLTRSTWVRRSNKPKGRKTVGVFFSLSKANRATQQNLWEVVEQSLTLIERPDPAALEIWVRSTLPEGFGLITQYLKSKVTRRVQIIVSGNYRLGRVLFVDLRF